MWKKHTILGRSGEGGGQAELRKKKASVGLFSTFRHPLGLGMPCKPLSDRVKKHKANKANEAHLHQAAEAYLADGRAEKKEAQAKLRLGHTVPRSPKCDFLQLSTLYLFLYLPHHFLL